MALYSLSNSTGLAAQVAMTTTDITLVGVFASTIAPAPLGILSRARIYDILVGVTGTPADTMIYWSAQRATTGSTPTYAGYASSITIALDTADGLTSMAAFANSSIETAFTYTATNYPWYVGVNQRASYRWVAAPGSEIVIPATSSAGVGLRARSASNLNAGTTTVMYSE